jgi:lipid-A-disaccharide synthase
MNKRLFIVTGDHSGDQHGARVVRALRQADPALEIAAVGGHNLEAAGAQLIEDQSKMGRVGFGAFTGAPYHYFLGRKILKFLSVFQPAAVLLIDYGGFNLWLAGELKKRNIPVYYFIPPQVWASRKGRLKKIQATVRRVFCIFPFEEALYQEHGIPVTFVGHPLVGQLPPPVDRAAFCAEHGLDPKKKIIALLPGSRRLEIEYLLKPIMQALPKIVAQAHTQVQFVMAQSGSLPPAWLAQQIAKATQGSKIPVTQISGQTHALLSVADVGIIKSGTATLEAALYHLPMVIIYKVQPFVYEIGRRLCYLPCLGLPNILTDVKHPPVPELLQQDLTPEQLANEISYLLRSESSQSQRQRRAFAQIEALLGGKEDTRTQAAERVAQGLLTELFEDRTPVSEPQAQSTESVVTP